MARQHIFFDLDGTLVDSAAGILAALQATLSDHGLASMSTKLGRHLIGPPLRAMLTRVTNADPDRIEAMTVTFMGHYDSGAWKLSRPYPGALELLRACHAAECPGIILTNKRRVITLRLLSHLGMTPFLASVHTLDSASPSWPSKSSLLADILRNDDIAPQDAVLVGDTRDDAAAATENGVDFYAAAWGYGGEWDSVPRHLVPDLPTLVKILLPS